jgi:acyl-CoA reductase-like NAD-dependent aldehyde dehydrogenase
MTAVAGDRTAIGKEEAGLRQLDALGPNGAYRAQHRFMVRDVAGVPVAELSLVPKLYVTRAMSALHRATTLPAEARITALAKAAELFAHGTVAGQSAGEYEYLVSRVSGMPISVVRAATASTAEAARHADASALQGRPRGAATDWREPQTLTGHAVWTRRGDVFAVHAAGNHPGVHGLWLEALALGYRVALRPSRREPFTPHRLISALREAGFGADRAVLLPTDYDVADEMLRGADLGMAYGGDDVMAKYAHDTTVLPQGPGRSKILVTADQDWREHVDTIVDSISQQGGTTCINATAVLVEGDPAPLAEAIASRLSGLPSLPPQDDRAVLPVQPVEEARRFEKFLLDKAADARAWLGGDAIVDELGDGSAALRPAVHQVDRSDAPQVKVELPFPCVWVAPWRPEEGAAPLRDSLVVTAITGHTALVDELIGEATISNVYVGDHPTCWFVPGIPHDDYLSSFLMRAKAVIT